MAFLTQPYHNHSKRHSEQGYLLLEAVISMGIFISLIVFFIISFQHVFSSQRTSWERVEAGLHAQEGMEIAYNLASSTTDWELFSTSFDADEPYHPEYSPFLQLLNGTEVLEDKFTREIFVQNIVRDPVTFQVVDESVSDAIDDPDTLRLITRVSWNINGIPQEVEYEMYVIKKGEE